MQIRNQIRHNTFYIRCIKKFENNVFTHGIENLFGKKTVQKMSQQFGEVIETEEKKVGQKIIFKSVKLTKESKVEVCEWLCENGDINDFKNFVDVFKIIEEVIKDRN